MLGICKQSTWIKEEYRTSRVSFSAIRRTSVICGLRPIASYSLQESPTYKYKIWIQMVSVNSNWLWTTNVFWFLYATLDYFLFDHGSCSTIGTIIMTKNHKNFIIFTSRNKIIQKKYRVGYSNFAVSKYIYIYNNEHYHFAWTTTSLQKLFAII